MGFLVYLGLGPCSPGSALMKKPGALPGTWQAGWAGVGEPGGKGRFPPRVALTRQGPSPTETVSTFPQGGVSHTHSPDVCEVWRPLLS